MLTGRQPLLITTNFGWYAEGVSRIGDNRGRRGEGDTLVTSETLLEKSIHSLFDICVHQKSKKSVNVEISQKKKMSRAHTTTLIHVYLIK